jgi:diadenosine tetraphosphate (Ap4A) HIT family hydrolase
MCFHARCAESVQRTASRYWRGEVELRNSWNSLPHLHMHFFPRYRGDCFEGQPINPRLVVRPVCAEGEFQRILDAFLACVALFGSLASLIG